MLFAVDASGERYELRRALVTPEEKLERRGSDPDFRGLHRKGWVPAHPKTFRENLDTGKKDVSEVRGNCSAGN